MTLPPRARLIELDAGEFQRSEELICPALMEAAASLAVAEVVSVRIHPATSHKAIAIQRAETAIRKIRRLLLEHHGLPDDSDVEIDDESRGVPVAPFHRRRFLLPHQDGGHCSFLTPSRLDCPQLLSDDRVFSSSVYWRRPSHKMYQGFVVTRSGEPAGETYYYNAVGLLYHAYVHRHSRAPADITALAHFCLNNIRQSKSRQEIHTSRYLTLGAFLGSSESAHHVLPSGPRAESEFWPAQYLNMSALSQFADSCPCGLCEGPGARVLCSALDRTLGLSWPRVRSQYETTVTADVHDLLLANNLTLFHAAESKATRTIVPMSIVVQNPSGEAYERWLSEQWRAAFFAAQPVHAS